MSGLDQTSTTKLNSISKKLFWLAIAWITVSSIYDTYLVYIYRHGVQELNPICNWLVQLAPGSAIAFVVGKMAGTLAVVLVLCGLYRYWMPAAKMAAFSVATFQIGLMCFIHTSETEQYAKFLLRQETEERQTNNFDPQILLAKLDGPSPTMLNENGIPGLHNDNTNFQEQVVRPGHRNRMKRRPRRRGRPAWNHSPNQSLNRP